MKKLNACIAIISSRTKCLRRCLESLHNNYNYKYDYPVYVIYFDDIYDNEDYRNEVHKNISDNIHFRSIPYKSPSHILESEMFYNQNDLWYVKNGSFNISRKGYLHMCNYWINFYGYPNTEFEKYDFLMTLDDESGYTKMMEEDPFKVISEKGIEMAAYISGQRLRNGNPHQGHRDTRTGLWSFTKDFMVSNGVIPKYQPLREMVSLSDEEGGEKFHFLPWSDTYVFNMSFARTELWRKWVKAVNDNGGVYKYRWGDNEIISLYGMMTQEDGITNLGYVKGGFHDQGLFRSSQNLAPSVKDTSK